MIGRILNACFVEFSKVTRQPITFAGPALVVLVVLSAVLTYPMQKDGVSDYAFLAFAIPMALNILGLIALLVFSASLISVELASGAVRTVLVRPLLRWEFYTAKLLTGMGYAVFLTALATATAILVTAGMGDLTGVEYGGEVVYSGNALRDALLLAIATNLPTQFAAVAYALLFSTSTRSPVFAVTGALVVWIAVDALKYPLRIAPFVFSTYLDYPWSVFADRCNAFERSFYPETLYGLGSAIVYGVVFFLAGGFIFARRNLTL